MKTTYVLTRKKTLVNQSGFSLVELMVVVAIIGILAAVAVPQFTKFQNKAKQSEAGTHLSGIYSAELSFYAQWNGYYGGLDSIGYAPSGRVRYNCGFNAAGPLPTGAPGGLPVISFQGNLCVVGGAAAAPCAFNSDVTQILIPATAVTTLTSFISNCITRFNNMPAVSRDTWTINQDKIIVQASNGI